MITGLRHYYRAVKSFFMTSERIFNVLTHLAGSISEQMFKIHLDTSCDGGQRYFVSIYTISDKPENA